MFSPGFDLRLVDMNVGALEDADPEWADMAFTSAMITQRVMLPGALGIGLKHIFEVNRRRES